MFLHIQGLKRDANGVVIAGTCSIRKSSYDPHAIHGHSNQDKIEKLGRIVWLSDDRKTGIFDSETRGLVEYSINTDIFTPVEPDDVRLNGTKYKNQNRIHTDFGNSYVFYTLLQQKTPYLDVIRTTFTEKKALERVFAHITHSCLRKQSSVRCGEFLEKNFISYILKDIGRSSLDCDTDYFKYMGDDAVKVAFFTNLVETMRSKYPNFGKACYLDSTPLTGEAQDNPFNDFSAHGTGEAVMQSRLVLILDIETHIPVWFVFITSTILDFSTIEDIEDDVRNTLGIDIDIVDVDAGYACKELFHNYSIDNATYQDDNGKVYEHYAIVRMPHKDEYPFDELYTICKDELLAPERTMIVNDHTYYYNMFLRNVTKDKIPQYCYVFFDWERADELSKKWRKDHQKEWQALTESQKRWYHVRNGFFILISNKKFEHPILVLVEYLSRVDIELIFKDTKSFLCLLPIHKWTKLTVKGKVLHDIISQILYVEFRSIISELGMSVTQFLTQMESIECIQLSNDLLEITTVSARDRDPLAQLGICIPNHFDLAAFSQELLVGVPMKRIEVTPPNKSRKTEKIALSPDEKLEKKQKLQDLRARQGAEINELKQSQKDAIDLLRLRQAAEMDELIRQHSADQEALIEKLSQEGLAQYKQNKALVELRREQKAEKYELQDKHKKAIEDMRRQHCKDRDALQRTHDKESEEFHSGAWMKDQDKK